MMNKQKEGFCLTERKTGKKKRLLLIVLVLLLGYLFCTPMGALRGAVARTGYPVSACTLQARKAEAKDVGLIALDVPLHAVVYKIEKNVPYEEATDAKLENWIVYRFGCFYFGKYYGWC